MWVEGHRAIAMHLLALDPVGVHAHALPQHCSKVVSAWACSASQWLSLVPGRVAALSRATGYVLIASPRLRAVSKYGAVFVGYIRDRRGDET
jgi:hypothetical protein